MSSEIQTKRTPFEVAYARAIRLADYGVDDGDGWRPAIREGRMSFAELEEGQYFFFTEPDGTVVPNDVEYAKWEHSLLYDGVDNYCFQDVDGCWWGKVALDTPVFGLPCVEVIKPC